MAIRLGASKTYKTPVKEEPKSEPIRLGTAARKRDEPIRLGKAAEKKIPTPVEQMENIGIKSKIGQAAFAGSPAIIAAVGLMAIGGIGVPLASKAASTVPTAVSKAAQVGKSGIIKIGQVASNPKTTAQTSSWLTRLFTQTVTKETTNLVSGKVLTQAVSTTMNIKSMAIGGAVGLAIGGIGTYPFDKFILEEAIQTTMFPLSQAYREQNPEAYAEARAAYDELLDQNVWDKILEAIPYANVINRLNDYKKAAAASVAVYDKLMENQMAQVDAMGEKEQQDNDFLTNTTIYNQKKIDLEIEIAAIRAEADKERLQRALDYQRDLAKMEEEDRKAIAEFWLAYAEQKRKIAESNRPSNLNFGLI